MKRYAFYMLVMAVAAVAACQKESAVDNAQEPVQKTYTYTVNAAINDVKSDYTDDGKFSWSAGDAISVLFHNGDVNKFFTLTTTDDGTASASFSGEIETGYVIGASDQTGEDKKIWALFPASDNHAYTAGSAPTFYVQPSIDFSTTHFSANIPMFALNAAEGAFSFANLACTYKFTVSGIKNGVSKVRFSVYNQTTYALSGSWPISYGSDTYINYNWASPGSANSTLTYISDVTSNKAVFYVSSRFYGTFQPNITVTNQANGVAIKTFTAANADTPNDMSHVKRITLDVSDGNYFSPAVLIDGVFDDWDGITEWNGTRNNDGSNSRINHWRMQADEQNVYIYLDLNTEKITNARYIYVGFDTDSNTATGSTHGNCPGCEQYVLIYPAVEGSDPLTMIHGVDPKSEVNGSSDGSLTTWCNLSTPNSLLELCIPRSKVGLSSSATIKVSVSYDNYDAKQQTLVLP